MGRSSRWANLHGRNDIDILMVHPSPNGGFVDKSGVALTSGGGTLVLATSGNVSIVLHHLFPSFIRIRLGRWAWWSRRDDRW